MARTGTALAMLLVLVLGCRRSPSNNPPDTPAAPAGPRWSALDRSVPFVSAADDPDEDSVAYQFDWGDGGRSAWTGLQPSGVPVSVFHVWNSLGSYSVLVRVRDVAGDSSDWSPAHVLTVDSSAGYLYHGIYPGGVTGEEDDITPADLQSYEQTVGKTAAWVYFSHNWYHGRQFPVSTCTWNRDAGSVPFVRLMMRSDAEQDHAETLYTLERIVAGEFDADLRAWARAARDFGSPILADYGVEMNGEWFPWNGAWNGGDSTDGYGDPIEPDGPERFRDAYKHIIGLCREEGAANVTWVFHVDDEGSPDEEWNQFENYYPGDEWIDWIGVSVYGALTPDDPEWPEFAAAMDEVYPRLLALARGRPIVVFELGATSGNPLGDQAAWADSALTGLTSFYWPRVTGFSWWNERWENEHGADTDMRVQDNPGLAEAFHRLVGNNPEVHGRLSYPR